jgi:hypothetical protein
MEIIDVLRRGENIFSSPEKYFRLLSEDKDLAGYLFSLPQYKTCPFSLEKVYDKNIGGIPPQLHLKAEACGDRDVRILVREYSRDGEVVQVLPSLFLRSETYSWNESPGFLVPDEYYYSAQATKEVVWECYKSLILTGEPCPLMEKEWKPTQSLG